MAELTFKPKVGDFVVSNSDRSGITVGKKYKIKEIKGIQRDCFYGVFLDDDGEKWYFHCGDSYIFKCVKGGPVRPRFDIYAEKERNLWN